MSALITQNVRPPKMSAPTTQNVWPPKTSAPKTQNVGTDHPKCPTTQNVGTENSKCRHRLHYTIDAVSVAMGNVDVRWLYSTVCAPYSIPYIIHWLNEFAEPISYDTVCPFGGPYHMIHCNSAMWDNLLIFFEFALNNVGYTVGSTHCTV